MQALSFKHQMQTYCPKEMVRLHIFPTVTVYNDLMEDLRYSLFQSSVFITFSTYPGDLALNERGFWTPTWWWSSWQQRSWRHWSNRHTCPSKTSSFFPYLCKCSRGYPRMKFHDKGIHVYAWGGGYEEVGNCRDRAIQSPARHASSQGASWNERAGSIASLQ